MRRGIVNRLGRIGAVAALTLTPACGTTCFVRGTRVATPRGPRPIDELRVGEVVWSWSLERRAPVERAVARVIRSERSDLFRVRAAGRVLTGVTPDHPFYDASTERFAPAIDLALRSRLLAWAGEGDASLVAVDSLERLFDAGPTPVWDLTIDGPEHDFFAEGVLVHNKSFALDSGIGRDASSCFAGETRVATPDGPRRIDHLREGERVWSWDLERQEPVARAIARVRVAHRDDVVDLRAGELSIRGVTLDHPVYSVGTSAFTEVGALTLGSRVLGWLGGDPRILTIDALVLRSERTRVYDLTIDGPEHDFFAEGILVHNKTDGSLEDAGARDAYIPTDADEPDAHVLEGPDAGEPDGGDADGG